MITIKKIEIKGYFGRGDFEWNLDPVVNILDKSIIRVEIFFIYSPPKIPIDIFLNVSKSIPIYISYISSNCIELL